MTKQRSWNLCSYEDGVYLDFIKYNIGERGRERQR